jgi:hypothetical protein
VLFKEIIIVYSENPVMPFFFFQQVIGHEVLVDSEGWLWES